jgi:alkylation response protein AidB-like acyl-CoA dehydrogenase
MTTCRVCFIMLSVLSFVAACAIHFDNTPVPIENVLGGVGEGFKVCFMLC